MESIKLNNLLMNALESEDPETLHDIYFKCKEVAEHLRNEFESVKAERFDNISDYALIKSGCVFGDAPYAESLNDSLKSGIGRSGLNVMILAELSNFKPHDIVHAGECYENSVVSFCDLIRESGYKDGISDLLHQALNDIAEAGINIQSDEDYEAAMSVVSEEVRRLVSYTRSIGVFTAPVEDIGAVQERVYDTIIDSLESGDRELAEAICKDSINAFEKQASRLKIGQHWPEILDRVEAEPDFWKSVFELRMNDLLNDKYKILTVGKNGNSMFYYDNEKKESFVLEAQTPEALYQVCKRVMKAPEEKQNNRRRMRP